jgi:outer membrane protein
MRFIPLLFGLLLTGTLTAQKIGHVDYGAILSALPDVKNVNTEVQTAKDQYTKMGQNLEQKMQAKYAEAQRLAETGKLTPELEQKYTAEIQKMQEDLEKFAAKAEEDLAKKRDDLLQPVLDRIEQAVKDVAKEKGFAYILDSSTLLFMDGGTDITNDVKAKLGIQ